MGDDVGRLSHAPVLPFMLDLLLREGGLVRSLLRNGSAARQADFVATYHFLMTCAEHDEQDARQDRDDPDGRETRRRTSGRRLTDRVGRIGSLLQETHHRRVFPSAAGLDAVAVSTIHAARGREFEAVHLCGVNALRSDAGTESFLVGVSRARTHLHLTRAEWHGDTRTKPSRNLAVLAPVLSIDRRT